MMPETPERSPEERLTELLDTLQRFQHQIGSSDAASQAQQRIYDAYDKKQGGVALTDEEKPLISGEFFSTCDEEKIRIESERLKIAKEIRPPLLHELWILMKDLVKRPERRNSFEKFKSLMATLPEDHPGIPDLTNFVEQLIAILQEAQSAVAEKSVASRDSGNAVVERKSTDAPQVIRGRGRPTHIPNERRTKALSLFKAGAKPAQVAAVLFNTENPTKRQKATSTRD